MDKTEGINLCRYFREEGASYSVTDLPVLVSRLDRAVKGYVCARRQLRTRKGDVTTVLQNIRDIGKTPIDSKYG